MKRALLMAVTILSACSSSSTQHADAKICEAVPAKGDPMVNCIHKYAYRLAKAPGSANEITDLVLEACSTEITNWVNGGKTPAERSDRDTIWDSLRSYAKYRVIEARAGHCDAP